MRTFWPIGLLLLLQACTTIPPEQRAETRAQVKLTAEQIVAKVVTGDQSASHLLDRSVGYLAGEVTATKLPVLGGGYGLALLRDTERGTDTYLDIRRFDLGAGLGVGRFRVLVIFETREAMEKFLQDGWRAGLAAESKLGESAAGFVMASGRGFSAYVSPEKGTVASATARLVRTKINLDLTDTGLTDISIPNTGFEGSEEPSEDAPRTWTRHLPFMAQKVIDKGYNLPLPYGIGVTYADVDQEQLLSSLEVGINGRDRRLVDFVEFENARSLSQSTSLKLDAWLFPFMNVYAMFGRVDGHAPVDVIVDGNGFLAALEVDCDRPPPSPLCSLLQDNFYTLPIDANFEGNTYGIGMTLAGGWKGWFVTVPVNWTYADMVGSETSGINFTATPRGGRLFNLGRAGSIAVFAGGNYLNSDLTVDGLATAPGTDLTFDYIIDQKNKDEWNVVVGFNWDINRNLSWSLEYDGFTGSRTAWISSLVWRY